MKCDVAWPVRFSDTGEESVAWECAGCGRKVVGVFDVDASPEHYGNVRLADTYFNHKCEVSALDGMKAFAAKLVEEWQPYRGQERRRSERLPRAIEVQVVPLNHTYSSSDEPFPAVVSNISQHSLGFFHTRSIDDPLIAVAMPINGQRPIQVIARVVRCNAKGRFYEIGCELKVRLGG